MNHYQVILTFEMQISTTEMVEAESPEQAKQLAEQSFDERTRYVTDFDGNRIAFRFNEADFCEVEPVQVIQVPEEDSSDRGNSPMEFTETNAGYEARDRWARGYDELNGAPESDDDR